MRILVLAPMLPSPPRSGTAQRLHSLISGLARSHSITLFVPVRSQEDNPNELAASKEYSERVITVTNDRYGMTLSQKRTLQLASLASPKSFEAHLHDRPGVQHALNYVLAKNTFDIVATLQSSMAYFRFPTSAPVVLDEQNIEFDILRRTARAEKSIPRRLYSGVNYVKLRREEIALWRRVSGCSLTSERDERLLHTYVPEARTTIVPNGVDTAYFSPEPSPPEPMTLLFFGTMNYHPNVEGLLYFLRQIWPLLKCRFPQLRLLVVGPRPPQSIRAWECPDITVTGMVDDLRPYLQRATAVIVPLRIGGGTRLKILEAMAMAKPIISTHLGAEGIDVTDRLDILLADQPYEFAEQVGRVLVDATFATRLGLAARALVERRYGWDASVQILETFYCDLLQSRGSGQSRAPVGPAHALSASRQPASSPGNQQQASPPRKQSRTA